MKKLTLHGFTPEGEAAFRVALYDKGYSIEDTGEKEITIISDFPETDTLLEMTFEELFPDEAWRAALHLFKPHITTL